MSEPITMQSVLNRLQEQGYTVDEAALEVFGKDEDDPSSVLSGLFGCAGWIAAVFFLLASAFCISIIGGDEIAALIFGLIITGVTVLWNVRPRGIFSQQLTLALHIAGQVLLVFGFLETFEIDSVIATALMIIILESVLIVFYHNVLFRFFAVLAVLLMFEVLLYQYLFPGGLTVLHGLMALAMTVIWSDELPRRMFIRYRPLFVLIGYALDVYLIAALAFGIYLNEFALYDNPLLYTPILTGIVLLVLLFWLLTLLLDEYDISYSSGTALRIFAVVLAIALPTLNTPGILFSFLLMFLGFQRRNRALLGLSYLSLAGFVIYFYYDLQITLLMKSIILIVTGVVMLIARFVLRMPTRQEAA